MFPRLLLALTLTAVAAATAPAIELPGVAPGPAKATLDGPRLTMENAVLQARWDLSPGSRRLVEVIDRVADARLVCDSRLFSVKLADGSELASAALCPAGQATLERITPRPTATRLAERSAGWRATLELATADGRSRFRWQAVLRDGSNYVRQEVALLAHAGPRPVEFGLLDLPAGDARSCGAVVGSPLVSGNFFLGCEHPLAKNQVGAGRAACRLPLYDTPASGMAEASAAVGVAPAGQLRRGFLYYLDRERARPYRPFTYYISWFDIAAPGLKMNQSQCVEVIEAFGSELARKRGVKLDAFVFDDGWDDNQSLWNFHAGFPHGFTPLGERAARYNAILGTWISPFGGYGEHKQERLAFGRSRGYETNRGGFALSGPKYFEAFGKVCEEMIRRYGIGYLKFDGIGGGSDDGPGAEYGGDMQALVHLFDRLRKVRPDLFINATTGTWPSPYWLFHSDTVWRGGGDTGYRGEGSRRQQWITYRDWMGYGIRTRRGPLFPFNSLKFQSVMCARLSLAAELGADLHDLTDDIRMAAASGTQLQEFFVTPAMMTSEAWDVAAEAIGWVQRNADVLADSHGIGGDPGKGEAYGFASWTPRMGIVALRNPTGQAVPFAVDVEQAFDLPATAARRYVLRTPWKQREPVSERRAEAGKPVEFRLSPWEVLVLEAQPMH